MEHVHQGDHQGCTDGVTSMETTDEHDSEELHSRDEADGGRKKPRVEEFVSADGSVAPNSTLNEGGDAEGPHAVESTRDYQGATGSTNASLAERVIEPTLVMFEVTFGRLYIMGAFAFSCLQCGVHIIVNKLIISLCWFRVSFFKCLFETLV